MDSTNQRVRSVTDRPSSGQERPPILRDDAGRNPGERARACARDTSEDAEFAGGGAWEGTFRDYLELFAYCSAITANSVSFAAVTPIRSKHSATMLLGVVNRLISRSIGVTLSR